jgi:hypothetical protein
MSFVHSDFTVFPQQQQLTAFPFSSQTLQVEPQLSFPPNHQTTQFSLQPNQQTTQFQQSPPQQTLPFSFFPSPQQQRIIELQEENDKLVKQNDRLVTTMMEREICCLIDDITKRLRPKKQIEGGKKMIFKNPLFPIQVHFSFLNAQTNRFNSIIVQFPNF